MFRQAVQLAATLAVAASLINAPASSSGSPVREVGDPPKYSGSLTSQPDSRIRIIVKGGWVRFTAVRVVQKCSDGVDRVNHSTVNARVRLRDSGVFKRVYATEGGSDGPFDLASRVAYRGRISGKSAHGTLYQASELYDHAGSCSTQGTLDWTAVRE